MQNLSYLFYSNAGIVCYWCAQNLVRHVGRASRTKSVFAVKIPSLNLTNNFIAVKRTVVLECFYCTASGYSFQKLEKHHMSKIFPFFYGTTFRCRSLASWSLRLHSSHSSDRVFQILKPSSMKVALSTGFSHLLRCFSGGRFLSSLPLSRRLDFFLTPYMAYALELSNLNMDFGLSYNRCNLLLYLIRHPSSTVTEPKILLRTRRLKALIFYSPALFTVYVSLP